MLPIVLLMINSREILPTVSVIYHCFSAAALLYGNNYQIEFSAYHLLQPNQSFLNQESFLPIKYRARTGLVIPFPGGKNKPLVGASTKNKKLLRF